MLKSSFTVLKGASAVGKGTRVCQLLMFLIDSKENGGLGLDYEYKFDDIDYLDKKSNKVVTIKRFNSGIYINELNVFFMSKWVKSNKSKLISLQGADAINSYSYNAFKSLINIYMGCNIISEGYSNLSSLPNSCSFDEIDELGVSNFLSLIYLYDNGATHLDLVNRCIERSGADKPCLGESAWKKNRIVTNYFNKQLKVLENNYDTYNNSNRKSIIKTMSHLSPTSSFGEEYLEFIGLENLIQQFLKYSEQHSTLRHYSRLDENYSQFLKYYEENKELIKIEKSKNV